MLTTISMTAVSVSTRIAQLTSRLPEVMKERSGTVNASPLPMATVKKAIQDKSAAMTMKPQVISSDPFAPMERPNSPAIRKPISGRNTIA